VLSRCSSGKGAASASVRPAFLTAALLFGVSLAGCHNTCVRFNSNSSTGTLGLNVNDSKSCTLDPANGTVQLHVGSTTVPAPSPASGSIQDIFVTLRGVEAHPDAVAGEDSPGWQELAPQLEQQPVQVDLMASQAASRRPSLPGEAVVPAGLYRQLRLRLLPNQPAASDPPAGLAPVPATNACGSVGWNCIVTADGRVRPLALEGASPELRIASERITSGSFLVLPDVLTHLDIRFNPYLSSASPAGDAVRLLPWWTVAAR
jgi:Domain of unknown function (DUF4382)